MRPPCCSCAAALALHAADAGWIAQWRPSSPPPRRNSTFLFPPKTERPSKNNSGVRDLSTGKNITGGSNTSIRHSDLRSGARARTPTRAVSTSRSARRPESRAFPPRESLSRSKSGITIPFRDILNTELRLIFYQPNSVGLPQALFADRGYHPRAASARSRAPVHLFGPNDSVTESDIRRNLKTGPAEDEVITAARRRLRNQIQRQRRNPGPRHVSRVDAGEAASHTGDLPLHRRASRARCPEDRIAPRRLAGRFASADRCPEGNRSRSSARLRYCLSQPAEPEILEARSRSNTRTGWISCRDPTA